MLTKQGFNMLRKVSKLFLLIAVLVGAGALLLVILIGIALYVLPDEDWKGIIPPQDCGKSIFSVKGFVNDEKGSPIQGAEIHAFNSGSYELPPFDVVAVSDEIGHFATQNVSSFACTPFDVEISAPSFQDQKSTFYPPGEQWPDELPESLTITLSANDSIQDTANP
jgi:hypothetical protein